MTYLYTFFLGREPHLSASEIWHALTRITPIRVISCTNDFCLVETDMEIPVTFFNRLGGSTRVGQVVGEHTSLPKEEDILAVISPTEGKKVVFGLSTLGGHGYNRTFLFSLKKMARAKGFSLKFVEVNTRDSRQLSSAQVLFNGLYRAPNAEITVIPHGDKYLLVRTIWVQDIQEYERRDTSRPVRDARVGMLPPKVAQTMINIGVGFLPPSVDGVLYDPFCGLGTVVQEGVLMRYRMMGSDVSEKMVEAARKNTVSAVNSTISFDPTINIFLHDATTPLPAEMIQKVAAVITEPFLGTPITSPLSPPEGKVYLDNLKSLYLAFFQQVGSSLAMGTPLLFILPRVKTTTGWLSFPPSFIDEINEIGYRIEHLVPPQLEQFFPSIDPSVLVYNRPDALVGREMRVWRKI